MTRLTPLAIVLAALLLPAPLARAQPAAEAPPSPARAALAAALARAEREALLGAERLASPDGTQATFELAPEEQVDGDPPAGLWCRVTFEPPADTMRAETTRVACLLDGEARLRRLSVEVVRGKERSAVEGRVEAGVLHLTFVEQRGEERSERREERPWRAEALPFAAVVTLLPRLAARGLLEGPLAGELFYEASLAFEPLEAVVEEAPEGARVRLGPREPDPAGPPPSTLEVDRSGRLRVARLFGALELRAAAATPPAEPRPAD